MELPAGPDYSPFTAEEEGVADSGRQLVKFLPWSTNESVFENFAFVLNSHPSGLMEMVVTVIINSSYNLGTKDYWA